MLYVGSIVKVKPQVQLSPEADWSVQLSSETFSTIINNIEQGDTNYI